MHKYYQRLRKLNGHGEFDIAVALSTIAFWFYWVFDTAKIMGTSIMYPTIISGLLFGTAIGHLIRVYYINLMAKKAADKPDQNLCAICVARHRLTKLNSTEKSPNVVNLSAAIAEGKTHGIK